MSFMSWNSDWTVANHNTYVTLTNDGPAGVAGEHDCVIAAIGMASGKSITAADVDGRSMQIVAAGTDDNNRDWYVCYLTDTEGDPETITLTYSASDTAAYALCFAVNTTGVEDGPRTFDVPDNAIEGIDSDVDFFGFEPTDGWADGAIGVQWVVNTFDPMAPAGTDMDTFIVVWDDTGASQVN